MRSEEEVRKALEFWKSHPPVAEKPGPIEPIAEALYKGITWALEWALGREVWDIAKEAEGLKWFQEAEK